MLPLQSELSERRLKLSRVVEADALVRYIIMAPLLEGQSKQLRESKAGFPGESSLRRLSLTTSTPLSSTKRRSSACKQLPWVKCTVLITCIITVWFEILHGNQESASAQLQSGIAVFQDWKQNERDASKYPIGFSSPAPNTIEDYLVQFFGRLEIQAMSFRDRRSAECHLSLGKEGKEVIQQMPHPLASINQAQVYLDLIMRRMMHFTASINHFKVSFAQHKETSVTRAPVPWIDFKLESEQLSPVMSPYYSQQQALNSEMASWLSAFTPLLNHSIEKGGRECISALTLSLAATTSCISLRAAFIKSETEYDVFEPEFNTIVSQAALLLGTLEDCTPRSKPTLAFSFDLGVIPPLYLTVVKCRVSEVRKTALELLVKHPRRHGVWDSVTTAAIGAWVTDMEEEEAAGEFVSEERRVRKVSIAFDLVERKATMTCLKADRETSNLVERRKHITW
jgi:hypothetical protein